MENLKNKSTNELYKNVDDILFFLSTHNKNYNKKQYEKINDLIDIFTELKDR